MTFVASHLSHVTFSLCGQAIGPNAAKLSSAIGKVAKSNTSPYIDNWSQVPLLVKEHVWEIVSVSTHLYSCVFFFFFQHMTNLLIVY